MEIKDDGRHPEDLLPPGTPGSLVWCPDDALGYGVRRVISSDGDTIDVEPLDDGGGYGMDTFAVGDTHPFDPTHRRDLPNLADMDNLHVAPLLGLLNRRHKADEIYTFTSDILISVNPYCQIEGLYELPEPMSLVQRALMYDDFANGGVPTDPAEIAAREAPHVFSVANAALATMLTTGTSQSVLMSGESGAGKTEASKCILRYLAAASNALASAMSGRSVEHSEASGTATVVERIIVESSPLLEALGNAKTVFNENSSRFGKFITIAYPAAPTTAGVSGTMVGAATETFLLERSRLVRHALGERTFHIFYQLCAGLADETQRKEMGLGRFSDADEEAQKYRFLVAAEEAAEEAPGAGRAAGGARGAAQRPDPPAPPTPEQACARFEQDVKEFEETMASMEGVGIGADERLSTLRVLGAVLLLGEAAFGDDGGDPPKACVAASWKDGLGRLAGLLGVGSEMLQQKLTERTMKAARRSSVVAVPLSAEQARDSANGLAKALYERLFNWAVRRVNEAAPVPDAAEGGGGVAGYIGILDIFGFENQAVNSFEQLCINYCNETLQQIFNHHVFVKEAEFYEHAGIDFSSIEFSDNQPILDLIDGRPNGVLLKLDSQSALGKLGSDSNFVFEMDKVFSAVPQLATSNKGYFLEAHSNYARDRFGGCCFGIVHYAGRVDYDARGFLAKNNDSLSPDLLELVRATSDGFITALFAQDDAEAAALAEAARAAQGGASARGRKGGGNRQAPTVTEKFRKQLESLLTSLAATQPHFVRCIKPNMAMKPHVMDPVLTVRQLIYLGVIETVRIRRQGFPVRRGWQDFAKTYDLLVNVPEGEGGPPGSDERYKAVCSAIATQFLDADSWQHSVPLKKIFLRDGQLVVMEAHNEKIIAMREAAAVTLQASVKGRVARVRFKRHRHGASELGRILRGAHIRLDYARKKEAALLMHAHARGFVAKAKRRRALGAARAVQSVCRMWKDRKDYGTQQTAAVALHAQVRAFVGKRRYAHQRMAATVMQATIARGAGARRQKRVALAAVRKWQACVRTTQQRKRYLANQTAAMVLHAGARGFIGRRRAWELRRWAALTTIQAAARGWCQRRRYGKMDSAASAIARVGKGGVARANYRRARKGQTMLAAHTRRRQATAQYSAAQKATPQLQRAGRGLLARAQYRRERERVTLLQAVARSAKQRKAFGAERAKIVKMQALARGIRGRERAAGWSDTLLQGGATAMQRCYRGFVGRRVFLALVLAQTREAELEKRSVKGRFGFNWKRRSVRLHVNAGVGAVAAAAAAGKASPLLFKAKSRKASAAMSASATATGRRAENTPGSAVELVGIKSKPELNGTAGSVVAGPDPESGRFQVKCALDGQTRALKPANLVPTFTAGSVIELVGIKSKPELNGTRGTVSAAVDAESGRCQVVCALDDQTRALKPANLTLAVAAGASVELVGIKSKPELNGTAGSVVAGPDPESGRFQVKCALDGQTRALKPANLTICVTPAIVSAAAPAADEDEEQAEEEDEATAAALSGAERADATVLTYEVPEADDAPLSRRAWHALPGTIADAEILSTGGKVLPKGLVRLYPARSYVRVAESSSGGGGGGALAAVDESAGDDGDAAGAPQRKGAYAGRPWTFVVRGFVRDEKAATVARAAVVAAAADFEATATADAADEVRRQRSNSATAGLPRLPSRQENVAGLSIDELKEQLAARDVDWRAEGCTDKADFVEKLQHLMLIGGGGDGESAAESSARALEEAREKCLAAAAAETEVDLVLSAGSLEEMEAWMTAIQVKLMAPHLRALRTLTVRQLRLATEPVRRALIPLGGGGGGSSGGADVDPAAAARASARVAKSGFMGGVRRKLSAFGGSVRKAAKGRGSATAAAMAGSGQNKGWAEHKAEGTLLYKSGDYAAAIAKYSQALAAAAASNSAGMASAGGTKANAIEAAKAVALEMAGEMSTLHSNRAAALGMLKLWHAAAHECRSALSLNTANSKARLRLAKALVQIGDGEGALAVVAALKVMLVVEATDGGGGKSAGVEQPAVAEVESAAQRLVASMARARAALATATEAMAIVVQEEVEAASALTSTAAAERMVAATNDIAVMEARDDALSEAAAAAAAAWDQAAGAAATALTYAGASRAPRLLLARALCGRRNPADWVEEQQKGEEGDGWREVPSDLDEALSLLTIAWTGEREARDVAAKVAQATRAALAGAAGAGAEGGVVNMSLSAASAAQRAEEDRLADAARIRAASASEASGGGKRRPSATTVPAAALEARPLVVGLDGRATGGGGDGRVADSDSDLLCERGVVLYRREDFSLASKHLHEVLLSDPDFAPAQRLLKTLLRLEGGMSKGNKAYAAGHWDDAAAAYAAALRTDASHFSFCAKLHFNRASALAHGDRHVEALAACSAALRLDPGYAKAFLRRAACREALAVGELSRMDAAGEPTLGRGNTVPMLEAACHEFGRAIELCEVAEDGTAAGGMLLASEAALAECLVHMKRALGLGEGATEEQVGAAYKKWHAEAVVVVAKEAEAAAAVAELNAANSQAAAADASAAAVSVAASAGGAAAPALDVAAMSLKEMKAYLGERGVDFRGCIEKGDFRNLAASTAAAEAGAGASQAAAPAASAGGGAVEAETEPVMALTSSRGGLPSSAQRDSLLPADGSAEARKQAFFASMQAEKVRVAPKAACCCASACPFERRARCSLSDPPRTHPPLPRPLACLFALTHRSARRRWTRRGGKACRLRTGRALTRRSATPRYALAVGQCLRPAPAPPHVRVTLTPSFSLSHTPWHRRTRRTSGSC